MAALPALVLLAMPATAGARLPAPVPAATGQRRISHRRI